MLRTSIGSLAAALLLAAPLAAQNLCGFELPALATNRLAARKVQQPADVTRARNAALQQDVFASESERDAINTAAEELEKSGRGARFIATDSGLGLVAMGMTKVETGSPNPTLAAIQEQAALVRAHLDAKAQLVRTTQGLSADGLRQLATQKRLLDAEGGAPDSDREDSRQVAGAFLRGAVLYDAAIDGGIARVFVLSTPKTQGLVRTESATDLTAGSMQAATELLMTEVRSGALPPLGGRILSVPSTGEIAWAGFGSAPIQANDDPKLRAELEEAAGKAAVQRASDALLALMRGESVKVESTLQSSIDDYQEELQAALAETDDAATRRWLEAKAKVLASQSVKEVLTQSASGTLPTGTQTETLESADGRFVHAIALYQPKVAQLAAQFQQAFAQEQPLGNTQRRTSAFEFEKDGSFRLGPDGRLIPRSLGKGRVTKDKDL